METTSNPDIPFERQMLHILRSYQQLQEENARLRQDNARLRSEKSLLEAAVARSAAIGRPADTASTKLSQLLRERDNRIRNLETRQSKLHSRLSDAYAELRKVRDDFKDYVLKHPHTPSPPQASQSSH